MTNPEWIEMQRDNQVATHAMNMPSGVLVRVTYAYQTSDFKIEHIPGIKAVKNPNGSGYVFCHG
ncbi:hypothetical protein UGMREWDR_CDS0091 [Aeromonas phage GomatiRiver_11]|nr:hypothetical protein OBDJBBDK_00084 [Aeromonas phage AhFM11]WKW84258.1 hypothetical protein UGMREWDR_CDS0091 [Aeromonas phage GomatiRiver_11]